MARPEEWQPWHDALITFMADPTDQRTNNQFCADYDIPLSTFYSYRARHSEEIGKAVDKARQKYILHLRQEAFKALGKKLEKSDAALKMAFQLTGDLVEKHEQRVIESTDDKRARAEALKRVLEEQLGSDRETEPQENLS